MNHKERYQKLLEIIEWAKKEGLTEEDFFEELNNQEVILKPKEKIVYVEKPFKTSPERLEYLKSWKYHKKQLEKVKEEEKRKQLKIENALKRKKGTCYKCNESVVMLNPTHKIEKKRSGRTHIIIESFCSKCGGVIRTFGGYYE